MSIIQHLVTVFFTCCLVAHFSVYAMDPVSEVVTAKECQMFLSEHNPEEFKALLSAMTIGKTIYESRNVTLLRIICTNNAFHCGTKPLELAKELQDGQWINLINQFSNSPRGRKLRSFKEAVTLAIKQKKELAFVNPQWKEENVLDEPLNEFGDTAAILAARHQNEALFTQLKTLGADLSKKNFQDKTADECWGIKIK